MRKHRSKRKNAPAHCQTSAAKTSPWKIRTDVCSDMADPIDYKRVRSAQGGNTPIPHAGAHLCSASLNLRARAADSADVTIFAGAEGSSNRTSISITRLTAASSAARP